MTRSRRAAGYFLGGIRLLNGALGLLGVRGLVPPRTSLMLVLISGMNTALAIAALERK